MDIIKCPKCGNHMTEVCPWCGFSLQEQEEEEKAQKELEQKVIIKCPKCGKHMTDICPGCGYSIHGEEEANNKAQDIMEESTDSIPNENSDDESRVIEVAEEFTNTSDEESLAEQNRLERIVDDYENRDESNKKESRRSTVSFLREVGEADYYTQFGEKYPTLESYYEDMLEEIEEPEVSLGGNYAYDDYKKKRRDTIFMGVVWGFSIPVFILLLVLFYISESLVASSILALCVLVAAVYITVHKCRSLHNMFLKAVEDDKKEQEELQKEYEEQLAARQIEKPQKKVEYEEAIKKVAPYNHFLTLISDREVFSRAYFGAAEKLADYLETGRADSIKEAINLFENEVHQNKMLRLQAKHNAEMEYEARRQARAMEEQAAAAQQQAIAAQQQAEAQREQTREQQRAAQRSAREPVGDNNMAQCATCANRWKCSNKAQKPKFCPAFRA